MIIEQNKKIVKIIETTKGHIPSPYSNPDQEIKLIIFNQIFTAQPSIIKSNFSIDLQHLNYHKKHSFTLQNSSIAWASIEHQIRQLLSKTQFNQEDVLIFQSSSYNEKIPQIFNRFKLVKAFNYRLKLQSLQNVTEDKKALMTQEHVLKQIEMQFSLGNGSYKPGYIGEIQFQQIQNPLFSGIITAYLNYSQKTQCPIVINFASSGQQTYQMIFSEDSSKIIQKFQRKLEILSAFLTQSKIRNCSKNLILYNLPIILVLDKSSSTKSNFFQNKIQEIMENYEVTLGFKTLRYSFYNQKHGIDQIIKIVNNYPQKVILSAGIKYKTDLAINNGQGLSLYQFHCDSDSKSILHMNSIEYLKHFVQNQKLQKVLKSNILRLFDWKQMKEEIKVEIFWKCDCCKLDFSQTIKAFGKFGKQFCSIKCLKSYKF